MVGPEPSNPGIGREHGVAQHQAKPLLRNDLFGVLATKGESLKDIRDRALRLTGIAGGSGGPSFCNQLHGN